MAKGWISPPEVPTRRTFGYDADLTGRGGRENPVVHSKNDRRYGRNEMTGEQPAGIYSEPAHGDLPIVHRNEPFTPHVETVGWPGGGKPYVHPTHPNADRRAAGGAVHTHKPLEPVGMTHSKTGGAHGEPQTLPASQGNGGNASARGNHGPHGVLNQPRDRNRGRT